MADLARIKGNVAKMIDQGAPEADIDAYISAEGTTVDAVRNFKMPSPGVTSALADRQPDLGSQIYSVAENVPLIGNILKGRDALASMLPQAPQASGDDPQARYAAALDAVRKAQYPGMSDAQWQAYSKAALAPYDSNSLLEQGGTLGFGDEIGSAVGALGSQVRQMATGQGQGFGDAFNTLQSLEQARRDLGRQQQGGLGTAAEVLGGLAAGGAAMGQSALATSAPAAAGVFSRLGQTMKALTPSLGEGAAYGFGSTDGSFQDRARGAGIGAAVAGVGGTALPLAARGLNALDRAGSNAAAMRTAIAQAPSAATIKAGARASYKASRDTGAVMSPPVTSLFAQDLRGIAANEGLVLPNGRLSAAYPKVANALRAADVFAQGPMSMPQFKVLHKMLRNVANSADKNEARVGAMLIDHLDGFVDNLPKSAFVSGDGKRAIDHWLQGQNDWARYKRTEAMETAISNAQLSPQGFAEGLRAEFRNILKGAKKARNFPRAQQEAMRAYVMGGRLEDVLKRLGNGSPFVAGVAGGMVGGPLAGGAALVGRPLLGAFARGRLNAAARDVAGQVRANMALPNGLPAPPPLPGLTPQQLMLLRQAGGIGAQPAFPHVPPPLPLPRAA